LPNLVAKAIQTIRGDSSGVRETRKPALLGVCFYLLYYSVHIFLVNSIHVHISCELICSLAILHPFKSISIEYGIFLSKMEKASTNTTASSAVNAINASNACSTVAQPQKIFIQSSSSSQATSIDTSDLECSLCFRLFCKPVSTPCGHTYCKSCLISALKYSLLCPLCRSRLDPPSKYKYSVNIVILNLLEKHFKEELAQRDKEEEEEQEQERPNVSENSQSELEDYYTRWSNCLIPSVRETCCALLSCT